MTGMPQLTCQALLIQGNAVEYALRIIAAQHNNSVSSMLGRRIGKPLPEARQPEFAQQYIAAPRHTRGRPASAYGAAWQVVPN